MSNSLALTKSQQSEIEGIPADDKTKLSQTMRNHLSEVFDRIISSRQMMLDKKKHAEREALKKDYIDKNPVINHLLTDLANHKTHIEAVIKQLAEQGVDVNGSIPSQVIDGTWNTLAGFQVTHYNSDSADKKAIEDAFVPATEFIDAIADAREVVSDPFTGARLRLQCANTFGEARKIINVVAGDTII